MKGRPTTATSPAAADVRRRYLLLLRLLALVLLAAAALVLGSALLRGTPVGLAVVALGLVLAAAACWRIRASIVRDLDESRAWAEVSLLRSILNEREALWSELAAPVAAWGGDGRFLMANPAWQRLAVAIDAPPEASELSVGEPPRLFVVDRTEQPSPVNVVVLREVTRERQALQAKDELLATVSHELRTPLSSIKGYGQLMARQLATVQEQVQRLDQLIGDVLDTTRADGGRLSLRREPLSIADVVGSACERFAAANPDRALERNLQANALIEGDAGRLNQVLDNLLSNAAKYSPPNTPIAVESVIDGEYARVTVRDRGIGIAAEHLPRLFDRFYRVSANTPGAPAGLGLGLSIVRDLVEAHGGRVDVSSNGPGRGAAFSVILPITLPLGSQPDDTGALTSA